MNNFLFILLWIWQLPQNLCGLLIKLYFKGEKKMLKQRGTAFYVAPTMNGGISLGNYIFISVKSGDREPVYDHEFGHCIQSRILGPFYVLVVGIPSLVHAMCCSKENYYHFYTEKWANKLGGIEGYRGEKHFHKDGVIYTTYQDLREKIQKWF